MSLGMRELGIRKVSAWDETGYIRRNAHDQVTRIKKFFATYLKRKKNCQLRKNSRNVKCVCQKTLNK